MDSGGIVWHSKLYNDSLTPKTNKMFQRRSSFSDSNSGLDTTELWTDSPWPARNNACFTSLNSFMERCNDVLELVQTTQHFEMLTCTAEVGGAGGNSLDSQVKEIHAKFLEAVRSFQQMPNVRELIILDSANVFPVIKFIFYQLSRKEYLIIEYLFLLYRQECFTGKYTARKIHMKLHPGPEWRIFHILTSEDIDDVISRSFTAVCPNSQ